MEGMFIIEIYGPWCRWSVVSAGVLDATRDHTNQPVSHHMVGILLVLNK